MSSHIGTSVGSCSQSSLAFMLVEYVSCALGYICTHVCFVGASCARDCLLLIVTIYHGFMSQAPDKVMLWKGCVDC